MLASVLTGLGHVVHSLLYVYGWVLVARAVVSWVSADPRHPVVRVVQAATDPLLRGIRALLPANLRVFPIDVAFLVLLALVLFSRHAVARALLEHGVSQRPLRAGPI
jgi:YggT family protein